MSQARPWHLRVADRADFPAVCQLFAELHAFNAELDPKFALDPAWQTVLAAHFERTSTAEGSLWLVAWADNEPVGFLLVEAHNDSPLFADRQWAELVALYVTATYRGSALADDLLAAGKRWAAEHGFDRLQLYVTTSNERAQRFYARHGLRPTQAIWRLDLQPLDVERPDDPSCDHQHLEAGGHPVARASFSGESS